VNRCRGPEQQDYKSKQENGDARHKPSVAGVDSMRKERSTSVAKYVGIRNLIRNKNSTNERVCELSTSPFESPCPILTGVGVLGSL
jgi:hypothetical protein